MFRLDLTLDKGLKELGEFELEQFILDRGHPIVQADEYLLKSTIEGNEIKTDHFSQLSNIAWDDSGLNTLTGEVTVLGHVTKEMIWNALEYGADWGRKGPVFVNFYISLINKKILITIEDPGNGFEIEKAVENPTQRAVGNTTRGNGLDTMKRLKERFSFSFEKIHQEAKKGFRTLLLYIDGLDDPNDDPNYKSC